MIDTGDITTCEWECSVCSETGRMVYAGGAYFCPDCLLEMTRVIRGDVSEFVIKNRDHVKTALGRGDNVHLWLSTRFDPGFDRHFNHVTEAARECIQQFPDDMELDIEFAITAKKSTSENSWTPTDDKRIIHIKKTP